jgi:GT2 family glycosyltransferase
MGRITQDNLQQSETPLVAVVILNWNQGHETIGCLEDVILSDYPNRLLFVVDNGSVDNSGREIAHWIAEQPSAIRDTAALIVSKQNRGFAGGMNLGMASALAKGADYVFLLNNDARVEPGTIRHLIDAAIHGGAAFVGALVLDSEREKIRFARRYWPWMLFGLTLASIPKIGSWWSTAYADGSALLIRADVLRARHDEHGHYFDERLFIYWEDVDLCRYGVSRGYLCLVARDARVYHDPGGSAGGAGNPRSSYYVTRNRIVIANRWLPLPWRIAFHVYYVPSRVLLQILRLGKVSRRTVAAVGAGLVDGYLGRSGRWSRHGETIRKSGMSG